MNLDLIDAIRESVAAAERQGHAWLVLLAPWRCRGGTTRLFRRSGPWARVIGEHEGGTLIEIHTQPLKAWLRKQKP